MHWLCDALSWVWALSMRPMMRPTKTALCAASFCIFIPASTSNVVAVAAHNVNIMIAVEQSIADAATNTRQRPRSEVLSQNGYGGDCGSWHRPRIIRESTERFSANSRIVLGRCLPTESALKNKKYQRNARLILGSLLFFKTDLVGRHRPRLLRELAENVSGNYCFLKTIWLADIGRESVESRLCSESYRPGIGRL